MIELPLKIPFVCFVVLVSQFARTQQLCTRQLAEFPFFAFGEAADEGFIDVLFAGLGEIEDAGDAFFDGCNEFVAYLFVGYLEEGEHGVHVNVIEDGAVLEDDTVSPRLRIAGNLLAGDDDVVDGLELGGYAQMG